MCPPSCGAGEAGDGTGVMGHAGAPQRERNDGCADGRFFFLLSFPFLSLSLSLSLKLASLP